MHTIYVRSDVLDTAWSCNKDEVLDTEWYVYFVANDLVGFRSNDWKMWYVDTAFIASNDLILLTGLRWSQEKIVFSIESSREKYVSQMPKFKLVNNTALRNEQSKEVPVVNENTIECCTCHKSLSTFGLIGDVITCDSCGALNSVAKDESNDKPESHAKFDIYGMWAQIMP